MLTQPQNRALPLQTTDELIELVECHLNALEEVGERQRFFREHGDQAPNGLCPSQFRKLIVATEASKYHVDF